MLSASCSTATTACPLRAKTSAMPAPMVPSPTTPTRATSRAMTPLLPLSGEAGKRLGQFGTARRRRLRPRLEVHRVLEAAALGDADRALDVARERRIDLGPPVRGLDSVRK